MRNHAERMSCHLELTPSVCNVSFNNDGRVLCPLDGNEGGYPIAKPHQGVVKGIEPRRRLQHIFQDYSMGRQHGSSDSGQS